MAQRDSRRLRDLAEAREQAPQAKLAIDAEVREQQKQLAVMAKKKKEAEAALAEVSSGGSGGFSRRRLRLGEAGAPQLRRVLAGGVVLASTTRPPPAASPRARCTPCSRPRRPATSGTSPVTASGGGGEHPKGRACDFAAAASGFTRRTPPAATRRTATRLAAFYVNNADRLGRALRDLVPADLASGHRLASYSGGGSPAADHTNHVHLSMY